MAAFWAAILGRPFPSARTATGSSKARLETINIVALLMIPLL
jgi:hypothetical protein